MLDACVLAPSPLFDTLLRLAEADFFSPIWSEEILDETLRTITEKLGVASVAANKRIETMRRTFPGAMTDGFDALIPQLANHPKDRHVLAAAIHVGASVIVTANLKDFPEVAVSPYAITIVHPDDFLLGLLDSEPDDVISVLRQQREDAQRPTLTVAEFYHALHKTVPHFASAAETLERDQTREQIRG